MALLDRAKTIIVMKGAAMPDGNIMAGWLLLFYGAYIFAAGLGEWRLPGLWLRMMGDINNSAALPFLTGLICILIGGFTLFLMGGADGPIINKLLIIMGAWVVVEGLIFIAIPDYFGRFASWLMRMSSRFWAMLAMILGLAMAGGGVWHILV